MRRRDLLALAGGTAMVAPAWAQSVPTIGYLLLRSPEASMPLTAAFRRGLAEAGFEENRNVSVTFASAQGQVGQLKALADDLVKRKVAVIFAASSNAALAAKAATETIPIVYTGASDPVRLGLVQSLGRPGGNVTGFTMYAHTFSAKRLEILHELVPQAAIIGVMVNPANPSAGQETQDLRQAAATLGLQTVFVEVRTEADLGPAFTRLTEDKVRALYIVDDPLFGILQDKFIDEALKRSIGMISTLHSFSEAGGLASYGTDFAELYRQAGLYVGRILKGESPANLPIVLPTRFSLTINLRTARTLGLSIAPSLLARADEVME